MIPKKESIRLFMELQTLEERGIGIWMEEIGRAHV